MTPDSPKGPERGARTYSVVELRDRIAQEISDVDGGASSVEPCGDATYQQMADAALYVVSPELERLTAEVEHHKRQHELWARLHTGEHEFVESLLTQGEIGIWLVAESRELLRGMARRSSALRRSWRLNNALLSTARREYKALLRLMANAAGITRMTVKPEQITELILRRRADVLKLREERDEWKQAAGAEADLLDQANAEVSRLREQLAAAVVLPKDWTDQIEQAVMGVAYSWDGLSAAILNAVVRRVNAWGVSSSEVEAPQPQKHEIHMVTCADGHHLKCACGSWWCGEEQDSDFRADQHIADNLRPVKSPNQQANQHDEGRPSGSEWLAPRSEFKPGDLVRWNGDTGWFEGEILRPTSDETRRSGGWTMLVEKMWDVAVTNPGTFYRDEQLGHVVHLTEERVERISRPEDAAQAARSGATLKIPHDYLSTACLHEQCDYCIAPVVSREGKWQVIGPSYTTEQGAPKTPAQCKFCSAPCRCGCHRPEDLESASLRKEGEDK